jgi:hypothetical protein
MRRLVVSFAVFGMLLAAAPQVSGHASRIKTRVTIKFTDNETGIPLPIPGIDDPDTFSGHVFSRNKKCVPARVVSVFRAEEGGPDLVGRDETDEEGAWEVVAEDPGNGTYFALVARKRIRKDENHRHICAPGASGSRDVTDG